MMELNKHNNKTILVSAPGGGIGKGITKFLLKKGYAIIGIGNESSRSFVEELQAEELLISFYECDCTLESDLIETFFELKSNYTKIDGLVHLVGGSLFSKEIIDLSYNDFRNVLAVNLDSTFLVGRETMIWMRETGGGNMVFFGSTTGLRPSNKKLPYGVAKAGVHSMTWFFAQEGSEYKIITNAIAPGYVLTERHIKDIESKSQELEVDYGEILVNINKKNPLNQSLKPENIGQLVELLLETKHIQGQIIRIDSGQILG